jgi:hypothetical protein
MPIAKHVAKTALIGVILANSAAGEPTTDADKRALAPLQAYVGEWHGVGQPKRGSNVGAWVESSRWTWQFPSGRAELVAKLADDKYFSQWRLQALAEKGRFALLATPRDAAAGQESADVSFQGRLADGSLVVAADESQGERPARITLRLAAGGDRMVALYERQLASGAFGRLAEVGSTRQGSSFAKAAAAGRECIVTGGLGTIQVEHKGSKYYVCCSGCRDYFRENPDEVLAEYHRRKANENIERKK